ncbi:zinc finger CCCH domain-containing protein 8 [Coccinella septempunctata]|uniref:zinc finger CCCH domain-containing protein 8 n=1 Tax=Coccinella septempunctata TaxID=41139 RepID=UPI001D060FE6|nr:zinc finger CCCH domain-containing protein 8 [Coccinella septempunctata]
MSLVPDYGDSSDSTDESSVSDIEKSETEERKSNVLHKLPTPDFQVKSTPDEDGPQTNSVFKNPFLEAENEKEALLQKHVRMVDLSNAIVINGKKICWNYRKGKCRFGHNCRFAHDSDIQKTAEQIEADKISLQAKGVVVHKEQTPTTQILEIDEKNSNNGKRKRPGLTQGLTPGKKVMKNYYNQKK